MHIRCVIAASGKYLNKKWFIFNSYVKLPEGKYEVWLNHTQLLHGKMLFFFGFMDPRIG